MEPRSLGVRRFIYLPVCLVLTLAGITVALPAPTCGATHFTADREAASQKRAKV